MILIEEAQDGSLLLVQGTDKTPASDPEMISLLRSFKRLQEGMDKERSPEKVAELMSTSGARLMLRLCATLAARLQDVDASIESMAEAIEETSAAEPPAPEGVLLTIDEVRLVLQPLATSAQVFAQMAAETERAPQVPGAPHPAQAAAAYRQIEHALGMLASRLDLGLRAYESAAAEEAAAEAAEEAEEAEADDEDAEEDA